VFANSRPAAAAALRLVTAKRRYTAHAARRIASTKKPGSGRALFLRENILPRVSASMERRRWLSQGDTKMDRREFRVSRMRNWLALLLMALAAMAAGRTHAAECRGTPAQDSTVADVMR
jgi:hypothetical protein